jgi:hypothetical protein
MTQKGGDMDEHLQSTDDRTVAGEGSTPMEVAELIEEAIGQVQSQGLTGDAARHEVVERVMEQVDDPAQRSVVAGHVHARMDLG